MSATLQLLLVKFRLLLFHVITTKYYPHFVTSANNLVRNQYDIFQTKMQTRYTNTTTIDIIKRPCQRLFNLLVSIFYHPKFFSEGIVFGCICFLFHFCKHSISIMTLRISNKFSHKVEGWNGSVPIENEHHPPWCLSDILIKPSFHKIKGRLV